MNDAEKTNIQQQIDSYLSADFESPFSKRSLSVIEKIKLAAADLLYYYKEDLVTKNVSLSESIGETFFGGRTCPNSLESVTLAMAKTYTLMLKIAEKFEDCLYNKYKIYKTISFGNPEFDSEKPIFKFTVSLNLVIGKTKLSNPVTIETSVLLRDAVLDPVFKPRSITKRGIVSSDINYKTKFNIDDFINEYKSLFTEEELAEQPKVTEIADDLIKDIDNTADKINRMLFTYLLHTDLTSTTALKDIRDRHCEMCPMFGCRCHTCDPLGVYEFDDENPSTLSKDTLINALIDIFNYYNINDRSACEAGGAIWNTMHWNILTDTDSDVYKLIFNEMFETYMLSATKCMLEELSEYKNK